MSDTGYGMNVTSEMIDTATHEHLREIAHGLRDSYHRLVNTAMAEKRVYQSQVSSASAAALELGGKLKQTKAILTLQEGELMRARRNGAIWQERVRKYQKRERNQKQRRKKMRVTAEPPVQREGCEAHLL